MVHPYLAKLAEADISRSSKKAYIGNLQTLCRDTGFTLEQVVEHPKTVYKYLRKTYPNISTRRSFIVAVRTLFRHVPGLERTHPTAAELWGKFLSRDADKVTEQLMSGEPTERQRENWVRWADVVAKERELAATAFGALTTFFWRCLFSSSPHARTTVPSRFSPTANLPILPKVTISFSHHPPSY